MDEPPDTTEIVGGEMQFQLGNFTQQDYFSIDDCARLFLNSTSNRMDIPANVTCLDHAPTLTKSSMTKSFVLLVLAILSLLGNVATMWSIRKSKRQRSAHIYTLIYHLSIADLIVTFWCIMGEAIWYMTVSWRAGNVECKIFKFAQMFSLYLSTFIMVLIGVDRFIAVKYPLKSMRKGLCFRLIALCWTLSAILSLPQMIVFHVSQGPFIEPFYQCVTHGFYTAAWQEQLYATFSLVCMFVLPLLILVFTYLLTVCTLHRNEEILDHSGSFRTLIDPNRRKLIRRAKMKSLRISVAIVATFLVCWTPYYVMMIILIFIEPDKNQASEDLQSGIFFFGMSNSLFNPVIYGVFHLWKPRRKELQRGHSSRKTFLTNLSFQRQRSSTVMSVNGNSINKKNNGNGEVISNVNGKDAAAENGNSRQSSINHRNLNNQSNTENGHNIANNHQWNNGNVPISENEVQTII